MLTLSPTLSLTLNLTINSQNNYFLESKTCRAPCVMMLLGHLKLQSWQSSQSRQRRPNLVV